MSIFKDRKNDTDIEIANTTLTFQRPPKTLKEYSNRIFDLLCFEHLHDANLYWRGEVTRAIQHGEPEIWLHNDAVAYKLRRIGDTHRYEIFNYKELRSKKLAALAEDIRQLNDSLPKK